MRLQNFGKFLIPFEYNGEIFKLNVTKFSTCNDVIHMILYKSGLPVSKLSSFGLFEKSDTIERLLSGNEFVHKIWRSWGTEKSHLKFVVCNIEKSKFGIKGEKRCSPSPVECDIDDLYRNHYMKRNNAVNNLQDIDKDIKDEALDAKFKTETPRHNLAQSLGKKGNSMSQSTGKRMVLARYLYDIFTNNSTERQGTPNCPVIRENGDGEDTESSYLSENSDASSSSSADMFNESILIVDDTFCLQNVDKTTSRFDECRVTLDTAFVKSSGDSDSDEGIDVTSVDSIDLDAAFIGDRTNMANDDGFGIGVERNNRSLPYNCYKATKLRDEAIRRLFVGGEHVDVSQDDEMESFMNSTIGC